MIARRPSGRTVRVLVVFVTVALTAWLLDFAAKQLALATLSVGEPVNVIGDLVRFNLTFNSGAAFGLGSGATWIFSLIALTVVGVVIWSARTIEHVSWAVMLGMLLGGTLGNLTDRLFREPSFGMGHVVDFIQIKYFAILNVADIFISASVVLFILLSLRGARRGA